MRQIRRSIWLSAAVIASGCIMAESAFAMTTTQRYRFNGARVQALLSARDQSGCVDYRFYFDAVTGMVQESSRPAASSMLWVDLIVWNRCTRKYLPSMYGESDSLPVSAIQVDRQLDWASLNATIMVFDYNGNGFPLEVNIAFAADGPVVYHVLDRAIWNLENLSSRSFSRRTRRNAFPNGSAVLAGSELALYPGLCRGGGGCSSFDWTLEGSLSLDFSPRGEDWGLESTTSSSISSLVDSESANLGTERSNSVDAGINDIDDTGCFVTYVDLFAYTTVTRETGQPSTTKDVSAWVTRFNRCTWQEVLYASSTEWTPSLDTVMDINLTNATVSTGIRLYDTYANEFMTIQVDLRWAATGPADGRTIESSNFTGPEGSLARQQGAWMPAAVSGTVVTPFQVVTANDYLTYASMGWFTGTYIGR